MRDQILLLTDQRGVALPMAMLALLILSALVIGFSVLASTEPTIANNQLLVAQARAIAEAGIERAMWALNNPTDPNGIPASLAGTAAAPYDGSQPVLVSGGSASGRFRVTVAKGASALERVITAEGWVPDDTNPRAHQKIAVTAVFPPVFGPPPAALSVRGSLEMGGNSIVDSRTDTSCGKKVGTLTTNDTEIQGNATDVWGASDNNDIRNEFTNLSPPNNVSIPADAHDIVTGFAKPSFDKFILTDADINALRTYAKAHGTYIRGSVSFNASNKIPNGLVFVDTVSGKNITQEGVTPATPISDFGSLTIQGNPPADPSGIFSGWLFVNGTLTIDGNFKMHGLAYAQNDIAYHGVGTGGVWGAMISRNIRDIVQTSIDSDVNGNALINYNCRWATNGGGMFQTWALQSGTYRELCDSCT